MNLLFRRFIQLRSRNPTFNSACHELEPITLVATILIHTLNNLVKNNELPDPSSHGSAACLVRPQIFLRIRDLQASEKEHSAYSDLVPCGQLHDPNLDIN